MISVRRIAFRHCARSESSHQERVHRSAALLVVAFIPVHISLWDKFPIWYQLTFLTSLVPLTYAGGTLTVAKRLAPA